MKKTINGKEYELVTTPEFECSCAHCAFGFSVSTGGCLTSNTECLTDAEITPKHWKEVKDEQDTSENI